MLKQITLHKKEIAVNIKDMPGIHIYTTDDNRLLTMGPKRVELIEIDKLINREVLLPFENYVENLPELKVLNNNERAKEAYTKTRVKFEKFSRCSILYKPQQGIRTMIEPLETETYGLKVRLHSLPVYELGIKATADEKELLNKATKELEAVQEALSVFHTEEYKPYIPLVNNQNTLLGFIGETRDVVINGSYQAICLGNQSFTGRTEIQMSNTLDYISLRQPHGLDEIWLDFINNNITTVNIALKSLVSWERLRSNVLHMKLTLDQLRSLDLYYLLWVRQAVHNYFLALENGGAVILTTRNGTLNSNTQYSIMKSTADTWDEIRVDYIPREGKIEEEQCKRLSKEIYDKVRNL